MADQQDRALIAVEHVEQHIQGVGIEIVGRFIEHEEIGGLGEDLGEQQPVALAT